MQDECVAILDEGKEHINVYTTLLKMAERDCRSGNLSGVVPIQMPRSRHTASLIGIGLILVEARRLTICASSARRACRPCHRRCRACRACRPGRACRAVGTSRSGGSGSRRSRSGRASRSGCATSPGRSGWPGRRGGCTSGAGGSGHRCATSSRWASRPGCCRCRAGRTGRAA